MQREKLDKLLESADETARSLGANSFEDGLDLCYRLFSRLASHFEEIRTRELLIQKLERSEFTQREEWLLSALVRFGPQFVRFAIHRLDKIIAKTLPAAPSRAPAIAATDQEKMLCFINHLHFENRIDLGICMKRAANRFGCGMRTVERCWADREKILKDGPVPHFSDVVDGLKEISESESA